MERIKQSVKIPVEYAEIYVDTSKEELSKLINNIIFDENFRIQLNNDPEKILKDAGILIDQTTIEKLKESALVNSITEVQQRADIHPVSDVVTAVGTGAAVVGVVIAAFFG